MKRSIATALLVVLAAAGSTATASGTTAHAAGAFNPRGIYDCSVLQAATGIRVYVTSLQFKSHHRYTNGLKGNGGKLVGALSTGRYKRSGSKIIPLSGRLKKLHQTLLIQTADLAVLDSKGHFTSLGCYQRSSTQGTQGQPGGQTTPPGGNQPAFPVGIYDCYHTGQQTNGSFSQTFAGDITFWDDGTYSASIRGPGWNQQGDTINFTAGGLWDDVNHRHDVGTWIPGGTAMPHATGSFAGNQYTLVIRSTRAGEGNPPMTEFTGPVPSSFNYCKHR
jgi:hypothetical protein